MKKIHYATIPFLIMLTTAFIPLYHEDLFTPAIGANIRVLNYNLHFGVDVIHGYTLDGLRDFVRDIEPNVVGFQEVTYNSLFNGFANMHGDMVEMMETLGFPYSYVTEDGRYSLRNSIFSQYPIVFAETINIETQARYHRTIVKATLDINGHLTHILVTHLTHLDAAADDPVNVRLEQAREFRDIVAGITPNANIIGMGDFNTEPDSQEYSVFTENLNDAWNVTNSDDPGYTFPSSLTAAKRYTDVRIDYILLSYDIVISACFIHDASISDHKALYCDITLS
jgi:endonuclease/exonuclease/phosphatase family metal-dependent hydrolase